MRPTATIDLEEYQNLKTLEEYTLQNNFILLVHKSYSGDCSFYSFINKNELIEDMGNTINELNSEVLEMKRQILDFDVKQTYHKQWYQFWK